MDTDLVLLWLVLASCLFNAKTVIQTARAGRPSFLIVFALVLAVAGVGSLLRFPATGRLSAALFALLLVLPGLLQRRMWRLTQAQRYQAALPYARALAILHPASGFPEVPRLLRALALAERGAQDEAAAELAALAAGPPGTARNEALAHLHRMRGDWAGYLAAVAHVPDSALPYDLTTLLGRLRGLGETGELDAMVALYARHLDRLRAPNLAAQRGLAQLFLYAFTGRAQQLEPLLSGATAQLPEATAAFWRATCAAAQGDSAGAQASFELLAHSPIEAIQLAAQRRLARPLRVAHESLSETSLHTLGELALEQHHDQRYGDHAKLKNARLTLALIALNLLAFAAEELMGGSEDGPTLYRLGAAVAGRFQPSESYRLLTAVFLHYGPLHLAMNMLNLALIGPFVEASLGKLRYLGVYLLSGLAGSLLVALIPQPEPGLFLGASGCIMGLWGATIALLVHGHRRERARPALRRLRMIALPLLLQLAFDLSVAMVSLTAHWSGVLVGFVLAYLLAPAAEQTPWSK